MCTGSRGLLLSQRSSVLCQGAGRGSPVPRRRYWSPLPAGSPGAVRPRGCTRPSGTPAPSAGAEWRSRGPPGHPSSGWAPRLERSGLLRMGFASVGCSGVTGLPADREVRDSGLWHETGLRNIRVPSPRLRGRTEGACEVQSQRRNPLRLGVGHFPGSLPQPAEGCTRPCLFVCVNAASRPPNLCFEYPSVFSLPRLCWLLPSVLFLSQYDKLYPCSPYLILVSSSFQNARSPVHPQQGARSLPQGKGRPCWPDENQALLMMLVFFLPALYAPLPLFGPAPGGPPEGGPLSHSAHHPSYIHSPPAASSSE